MLAPVWSHRHEDQLRLFFDDAESLRTAVASYEALYFSDWFDNRIAEVRGAGATLLLLMHKYSIVVVSGMHPIHISSQLARLGIDLTDLAATVSSYDTPLCLQKPNPYMLLKAIRTAKSSVHRTVYIGDGRLDIEMANSATVKAIAVLTGEMNRHQATEANTAFVIPSIVDLPDLLARQADTAGEYQSNECAALERLE